MRLWKKCLILFIVLSVALYFLCTGIWGRNGYFYNCSLKALVSRARYQADRLEVEVDNLREQDAMLSTEEGIRDAAIGLGYYIEGDTVYLFSGTAVQDSGGVAVAETGAEIYEPLSKSVCAAIACASAGVIALLFRIFGSDEDADNEYFEDDKTEEPGNFDII